MKSIAPKLIIWIGLLVVSLLPAGAQLQGHQGHHQSGITGRVNGGMVSVTPTGEGSMVIPDYVRVYSDTGELVTEVETEVTENATWHFDVYLKPGRYMVMAYVPPAPEDGGVLYTYPVAVTVEKKQFTDVVLTNFRPL
jgi:hypothetical protein